jgi:hypothetical protein
MVANTPLKSKNLLVIVKEGHLPFLFLLENMMLSDLDRLRLKELVRRVANQDEFWLTTKNINFGKKGDFWILNYGIGERNEYNRLARGLVVHQPTKSIQSFPFTRFFNFGEKEAEVVDLANADLMEKMDGTMVGVSFSEGKLFWQTRKMLSTHDNEFEMKSFYGDNFKLMSLIGEYVQQLAWDSKHADYTFVFEFIHKHTQVITQYQPDQYGLYLIGGRDMKTYHELSEKELDAVAIALNARRPRRWDTVASHEEIVKLFEDMPKDFEGFVVRERDSARRIKVKSEDYVKVHHLITKISYKNLLRLWMDGEGEEVCSYFKEAQDKINTIEKVWKEYIDNIVAKARWLNSQNLDRKTLQFILNLVGKADDELPALADASLKTSSVNTLLEALKLTDDNDASVMLVEEL